MGRNLIRVILICTSVFWACDDPFSYSPYEVSVPVEIRNTTQKNLELIALSDTTSARPFKIALLADSHYFFEELQEAISHINERRDLDFIIVVGDIADNGLQEEFESFYNIMALSRLPYLTVIGNHDYLSNGAKVYQHMFGPLNYSFTYRGVKFVMWDDVVWESPEPPDWQWFKDEISGVDEQKSNYRQIIPISHIPPEDPQLMDSAIVYHQLMVDHNITMSVHGHQHEYNLKNTFGDNVEYLIVGSPQYRAYAVLTIGDDAITTEKVEF